MRSDKVLQVCKLVHPGEYHETVSTIQSQTDEFLEWNTMYTTDDIYCLHNLLAKELHAVIQ